MGFKAGRCNKLSTPKDIFIMTPSLEGWPAKLNEAPCPNELRLTLLEINPAFRKDVDSDEIIRKVAWKRLMW